ncbi:hypothetical protein T02_9534 [Trichinella nativa]|uniref:Uncharacterized protein n=1 Tax=Trichinella nativa TaxID=6335 RepID=A0A0V1KJ95_9BILA|nr:hypothetical protein T02_9534 [Trichinella nativa]
MLCILGALGDKRLKWLPQRYAAEKGPNIRMLCEVIFSPEAF